MKNKVDVLIIGAGVGGLGAACWMNKKSYAGLKFGKEVHSHNFMVAEGSESLPMNLQNGVHYLHSEPLLPFKPDLKRITLTDGVLCGDEIIHKPSLIHALEYSEKVREVQHPSSIMEIGKETSVFMPKSNSMNELMQEMYDYAGKENFEFGCWLTELDTENKIATFKKVENGESVFYKVEYNHLISTAPLDKFRKLINDEFINSVSLTCAPVHITNYKVEKIVPNWMINLYIPDKNSPIYRASILNGVCSVESIRPLGNGETWQARDLLSMFHLVDEDPQKFTWNTGKVISISIDDREKILEILSKVNIHLVGRFARWDRKLLIDSTIDQAKNIVDKII